MTPPQMPSAPQRVRRGRGFGAIAAIVVLVVLAALAAAVLRLGAAQQQGQAQAVLGARATLAVHAGLEWGRYQALKGAWTACAGATTTLDLGADTGMRVRVQCQSAVYNDGETAPGVPRLLRIYTLDAVACNAAACPDDARAAAPGYIERRRSVALSGS